MKRGGASYGQASKPGTIDEDRDEEDRQNAKDSAAKVARQIGELAPPIRKSTSESRFNEIDLDWSSESTPLMVKDEVMEGFHRLAIRLT